MCGQYHLVGRFCINYLIAYLQFVLTNTFQCVLATSGVESFVIFLYADGRIQWTTGDRSGGDDGLGGTEALAGINAGDGRNFVTIPGSRTSRIINIPQTSNVDISGIWMFKVDQSKHSYSCIMYCT